MMPFVVWVLGWPLVVSVSNFLSHLRGRDYSDKFWALYLLMGGLLWFVVAVLLWRRCK